MAKRILDMLRWHPEMNMENCRVTYLHRGSAGNLKTIPAKDIQTLEGGFMIMVDGAMIPYHRIVKIECDNRLIWKKNPKKVDLDDHVHSG
jgi:uncharacterized protein